MDGKAQDNASGSACGIKDGRRTLPAEGCLHGRKQSRSISQQTLTHTQRFQPQLRPHSPPPQSRPKPGRAFLLDRQLPMPCAMTQSRTGHRHRIHDPQRHHHHNMTQTPIQYANSKHHQKPIHHRHNMTQTRHHDHHRPDPSSVCRSKDHRKRKQQVFEWKHSHKSGVIHLEMKRGAIGGNLTTLEDFRTIWLPTLGCPRYARLTLTMTHHRFLDHQHQGLEP